MHKVFQCKDFAKRKDIICSLPMPIVDKDHVSVFEKDCFEEDGLYNFEIEILTESTLNTIIKYTNSNLVAGIGEISYRFQYSKDEIGDSCHSFLSVEVLNRECDFPDPTVEPFFVVIPIENAEEIGNNLYDKFFYSKGPLGQYNRIIHKLDEGKLLESVIENLSNLQDFLGINPFDINNLVDRMVFNPDMKAIRIDNLGSLEEFLYE